MKKIFRVLYRYKGDTQLREYYTPASNVSQAIALTREIFGKIKITDCYLYH